MKILNQKGFMMAEVIVVSTIILGTLIGLYSIFNKMYIVYTERSYYYNVDAVYALRSIYKDLVDNEQFNILVNDGLQQKNTYDEKLNYIEIIKDDGSCSYISSSDVCQALIDTYSINRVFFVMYDENTFTNVELGSDAEGNVTNNEKNLLSQYKNDIIYGYFDYLNDSMDFGDNFSYMFIVELENETTEIRYYGNYRIR